MDERFKILKMTDVVYLSQAHFEEGTIQILKGGAYTEASCNVYVDIESMECYLDDLGEDELELQFPDYYNNAVLEEINELFEFAKRNKVEVICLAI